MLCEAVYGLIAPSKVFTVLIICGLHSIDICGSNVKCKLRILTVCAACTIHDRGSDINLRSEKCIHTSCTIFFCCFLADFSCKLCIHCGCQGKSLNKTGNISRVNGDHSRDSVEALLCNCLNCVCPFCMSSSALFNVTGNATASALHQVSIRTIIFCKRLCCEIAPATMCQDCCHFLALHLVNQISCTLFCGKSPVLIFIKLTVLVHILECIAVNFKKFYC